MASMVWNKPSDIPLPGDPHKQHTFSYRVRLPENQPGFWVIDGPNDKHKTNLIGCYNQFDEAAEAREKALADLIAVCEAHGQALAKIDETSDPAVKAAYRKYEQACKAQDQALAALKAFQQELAAKANTDGLDAKA